MVVSGHEWPYDAATSVCIQLSELSGKKRADRRCAGMSKRIPLLLSNNTCPADDAHQRNASTMRSLDICAMVIEKRRDLGEKHRINAETAASWITIAFALSPQAWRDMVSNSNRYSRNKSPQCQERVAT